MFEDKNIIRIEEKQFNSNRPMFKGNSQWALVVSQFVDQWYDQHYYTCKRHFCVGDCSSAPGAFCYLWKQFAIFDQKMGPVRVGQSKLSVFGPPVYPNNSFHLEQSSVGDKLLYSMTVKRRCCHLDRTGLVCNHRVPLSDGVCDVLIIFIGVFVKVW